jgi:hypothetical protein
MSNYQRGAGLLTAEARISAGAVLAVDQVNGGNGGIGAGGIDLEINTAGSYDVFDFEENTILEEDNADYVWEVSLNFLGASSFESGGIRTTIYVACNTDDDSEVFGLTATWANTAVRDMLGFTGSETWETIGSGEAAFATYRGKLVASRRPIGVWYAGCPMQNPYGHRYAGHFIGDLRHSISPLGHVRSLFGNKMRTLEGVSWSHVVRNLAITDETDLTGGVVTNLTTSSTVETRSFEEFLKDTQFGERSPFVAGSPIRLYWDTAGVINGDNYDRYRMIGRPTTQVQAAVNGWDRLYTVALGTLIKVPA